MLLPVVFSGISVEYQWKLAVKFGDITMDILCITTVLPLKSTVLPVVIAQNFTSKFH